MELYLNNVKSEHTYEPETKIGFIIEDITKKLKESNQVICQLSVNDVIISEDKQEEILAYELKAANKINLMVDTINNLAVNGLKSLETLIPELIVALNKTADLHRTGQDGSAKNIYSTSLEALEIVPTVLGDVRGCMKLNFEEIISSEIKLSDLEKDMLNAIKSVFDAQKKEDYVTLADVLEYELIPNLEAWHKALKPLQQKCIEGEK